MRLHEPDGCGSGFCAIRAPGRVASITLLDPAGLTKLDARFWWWFSVSGLASLTPMPLRRHLARWLDSPAMLQPELMTLMWAGTRGYRAEPKFPRVLTEDELRAIDVPVLLITGTRSALLTPAEAHAREASCRTQKSPSSPAATAASTASMN